MDPAFKFRQLPVIRDDDGIAEDGRTHSFPASNLFLHQINRLTDIVHHLRVREGDFNHLEPGHQILRILLKLHLQKFHVAPDLFFAFPALSKPDAAIMVQTGLEQEQARELLGPLLVPVLVDVSHIAQSGGHQHDPARGEIREAAVHCKAVVIALDDLLADFCFGGYRVLSDLIFDIDDENTTRDCKRLIRDGNSSAFVSLMEAYQNKSNTQTYREAVSAKLRTMLDGIVKPVTVVRYVVALGKRDLLWNLQPDAVPPNVLELHHDK